MRLRAHRRRLVVWTTRGLERPGRFPVFMRLAWHQTAPQACPHWRTVIGLLRLARAVRPRWRLLLAGCVLTGVGVALRNTPGGIVIVPGLACLLSVPLIEGGSDEERKRRSELERELAGYSTPGQRRDLEAMLDRYPDAITCELWEVLARQAMRASGTLIPGAGRH
jgi:hypothetical protein